MIYDLHHLSNDSKTLKTSTIVVTEKNAALFANFTIDYLCDNFSHAAVTIVKNGYKTVGNIKQLRTIEKHGHITIFINFDEESLGISLKEGTKIIMTETFCVIEDDITMTVIEKNK